MSWVKKQNDGEISKSAKPDYDKIKKELLPVAQKEADSGVKTFDPLIFQPVQSPGNYEAEFGVKNGDLIFHFWPWKYHELARKGANKLPSFKKNFGGLVVQAMGSAFNSTNIVASADEDMGSWFVKIEGVGHKTFCRELAIKACEELHRLMSGS